MWCLHSAAWQEHWQRTGIMNIELADTMADGWQAWLDWHRVVAPDNAIEIQAVEADAAAIGYVRVVGRRTDAKLDEPIDICAHLLHEKRCLCSAVTVNQPHWVII